MNVKYLTTPWQRARGAMFRKRLENQVLFFVYLDHVPRLFHTFFCPPLRIIVLDDAGHILFDQVKQPGAFVRLPASRWIVEADPALNLPPAMLCEMTQAPLNGFTAVRTWDEEIAINLLAFALFRGAVADMRKVHEAHARSGGVRLEVLRQQFIPWERGHLVNSAGFLLDFSFLYDLPETVLRIARQLLDVEQDNLSEITAASVAGMPWHSGFPIRCLRCGKTAATWRAVLSPCSGMVPESAWRYQRPENHVPLCRRCANWLSWHTCADLRLDLAQGLWGRRYDAFYTWCRAAETGRLPPDWDRERFPLWPREFGGQTWAMGSGAFDAALPRPPEGISRTKAHLAVLPRLLNGKGGTLYKRGRGTFAPWHPLLELVKMPLAVTAKSR